MSRVDLAGATGGGSLLFSGFLFDWDARELPDSQLGPHKLVVVRGGDDWGEAPVPIILTRPPAGR